MSFFPLEEIDQMVIDFQEPSNTVLWLLWPKKRPNIPHGFGGFCGQREQEATHTIRSKESKFQLGYL